MLQGLEPLSNVRKEHPKVIADLSSGPVRSGRGLVVWIDWRADGGALRRAVKPRAVLEQFTLASWEPALESDTGWLCRFEHVGRSPDFDRQIVGLLRRLGEVGRWTRAEVIAPADAATEECEEERLWRAFERRALP